MKMTIDDIMNILQETNDDCKFDFSEYSVGDIARIHKENQTYYPGYVRDMEIIDITTETITVSTKYSCKGMIFGRNGKIIGENIPARLISISKRSPEEKAEQARLKAEYKILAQKTHELSDEAHKKLKELLQPAIEYAKTNNICWSISSIMHNQVNVHEVRTSKELDALRNKIHP